MEDQIVTLSPGLFFEVGDWDDGVAQVAIDAENGGDSCLVTPDQAAFMRADLNRWILLSVEAAEAWFASAIRRARAFTAAQALLAAE